MHKPRKLALALLSSALLLAAVVNSARANHLAWNEQWFRVTYLPLSFVPSFGSTVRCPVTLQGSYHSQLILKTEGALVGHVNGVTVGRCEAGVARANTETLPWHIQYAGFTGTLPNITSIMQHVIRMSFEIQGEIFGIPMTCRYTTPAQQFSDNRESIRGTILSQTPGTESTRSETEGCPSGRRVGTGTVTQLVAFSVTMSLS